MIKTEFKMPKMGESITEGTIIEWRVNEGDSFEEGDILLEVATDKVDNEVPASASGIMVEHKFKNGDIVPIGEVVAILELSENDKSVKTSDKKKKKSKSKELVQNKPISTAFQTVAKATSFKVNDTIFVSPLVDSIARKNHISYEELARIPGTGKEGR